MTEAEAAPIKYVLTGDEAMCLLARAVSLKHDLFEPFFNAAVTIKDNQVKKITFDFYGDVPKEENSKGE